ARLVSLPVRRLWRPGEKPLCGRFTCRVPLNYVALKSGLACHVFELDLAQLLKLSDLLASELTVEVDRIVPVQEVGCADRPQYPQHALFGRQQLPLDPGSPQDALCRIKACLSPDAVLAGIRASRGSKATGSERLISRVSLTEADVLVSQRIRQRLTALNHVGKHAKVRCDVGQRSRTTVRCILDCIGELLRLDGILQELLCVFQIVHELDRQLRRLC